MSKSKEQNKNKPISNNKMTYLLALGHYSLYSIN